MDSTMIDTHLENIDRRLTKLEQILPTLATKEELAALSTKIDVVGETLRGDIQLLAEHLVSVMPKPLKG